MLELLVIGIGTGNPEHMTVQAIKALNRADLVLIPRKGAAKADLAELRREICDLHLDGSDARVVEFDLPSRAASDSYLGDVDTWHKAIAATYRGLLAAHAARGGVVAFLVWGDPALYDSTLRILDHLKRISDQPFDIKVVPGISSLQALAASHRLALNSIGEDIRVTTGRRLREEGTEGADSLVVMLDGECSFRTLPGADYTIHWGAYLGMEQEIIIAGPLSEVAEHIVATREKARARHGWIMDIYLLRRR